jgi:fermentation-respiration switch protein FrsA (DUF1100 family)
MARWIGRAFLLAVAGGGLAATETPREGRNEVTLRGHVVDVYWQHRSDSAPPGATVLFCPGDGGWRGAAVSMGAAMASWGHEVFGLDTKIYLESFTGKTRLAEGEVAADIHALAAWATPGEQKSVILVGWSEGAGLAVLAAASPQYQSKYLGVVTMGLSDRNAIGWRWSDDLTYLTGRPPNEPTFSTLILLPRVAPLPVVMLQSSRDAYVSTEESRKLFDAAAEPKRYFLIQADNHRYDGNLKEFYRRLQEALRWVEQVPK